MIWVAGAALLAWAWLLLAHGRFWRAEERLGDPPAPAAWPEVVAVIPARNEAAQIAETVASHGASAYPGRFRAVIVDDASTDGTGEIARAAAAEARREIEVLEAPPLPPGWTGKLAALDAGLSHALAQAPGAEWVLLTDADIRHRPDALARLVAKGEAEVRAMVSLMAVLDARGVWGGLLIPAFVFFFAKLYPFRRVNDPASPVAGAAGGCVLIRREALEEISGIAAIRGALIDDCTLAAKVKGTGRSIWLGFSAGEVVSLRDNRPLSSVWTMVSRTAFTQLRHSVWLLAGTVLGMAFIYLAGPAAALIGLASGDWPLAAVGTAVWAAMALAWTPVLRLYGKDLRRAALLPLAALLYTAMTVSSAVQHWRGKGGAWKGRIYPTG